MKIHPSTVIQGELDAHESVEVGPYCLIQGKVKLGAGCIIEGHATLGCRHGELEIGERNHFFPGSAIGGPPQDLSYKNQTTRLKIGNDNIFREFSTANMATQKGDGVTSIGDHNYFMSYTHIGHDCKVGNHIVIANDTHVGGHVTIEDHVTIGGVCAFNQNTVIGKYSFIAGSSVVNKDILPYSKAQGVFAVCRATNKVGLQRKGFAPEEIDNIHRAIRIILMGSDTMDEGIARIQEECMMTPALEYFVQFIRKSERGIAR